MTSAPIWHLWFCAPQVRYGAAKAFFPGGRSVAVVDFQRQLKSSSALTSLQGLIRAGIDRKVRLGEEALVDAKGKIGRYLWDESILPELFSRSLELLAKYGEALRPDLELVRLRQLNPKLPGSALKDGRVSQQEVGVDFSVFLKKSEAEQLDILVRMGVIVLNKGRTVADSLQRANRGAAAALDALSNYRSQFWSDAVSRKRAMAIDLLGRYCFLGAISLKGAALDRTRITPEETFSLGIPPHLLSEALHTVATRSTALRDIGCTVILDNLSALDPLALTEKPIEKKLGLLAENGVLIFPAGKTIDDLVPPPQPTPPARPKQGDLFGYSPPPKKRG